MVAESRLNPDVGRSEEHLDVGSFDFHVIPYDCCGGIVHASTGRHVVFPPMPWTGDDMPCEIAFAQGTATMDTGVVDHVERPIHIKDRESFSVHFCHNTAAWFHIRSPRHTYELSHRRFRPFVCLLCFRKRVFDFAQQTFNRRNIFARDANQCQYCGKRFVTSELSLDHILPTCRGGGTSWENLVCACVKCNVRKGGRTPYEAGMKLIRKPVRPKSSPILTIKLGNPKYASWKTFLDNAYWSVDLK